MSRNLVHIKRKWKTKQSWIATNFNFKIGSFAGLDELAAKQFYY
jgi:hypothetical protein